MRPHRRRGMLSHTSFMAITLSVAGQPQHNEADEVAAPHEEPTDGSRKDRPSPTATEQPAGAVETESDTAVASKNEEQQLEVEHVGQESEQKELSLSSMPRAIDSQSQHNSAGVALFS